MAKGVARDLVGEARKRNANPREWRGTFDAVPREKWLAIEVFERLRWVPFETPHPPSVRADKNHRGHF